MKIKSIKWNGQYKDRVFNGETLGKNFVYSNAVVGQHCENQDFKKCSEIIEESLTTYLIKFENGTALRVFNPIEVEFIR